MTNGNLKLLAEFAIIPVFVCYYLNKLIYLDYKNKIKWEEKIRFLIHFYTNCFIDNGKK